MKLIYLFILACAESSLQRALSLGVVSRGRVAVRGILIAMASLVVIGTRASVFVTHRFGAWAQ